MNTLKYKQLAVNSPGIVNLKNKIQKHFNEWTQIIIDTNIWTFYKAEFGPLSAESCAAKIFFDALWGYGVLSWDPRASDAIKSNRTRSILTHVDGTIPLDFYYLDQWLEDLISR